MSTHAADAEHVNYGFLNQDPLLLEESEFVFEGDRRGVTEDVYASELEDLPVDHARFIENFRGFLDSRKILKDPNTKKQVATYWANQDQLATNGHNLTAIVTTWTSSMESNGGNRREYALVAAMSPDVPFVVIDNPGSGFSEKLPDDVITHMIHTGEFDQAGSILGRALASEDHYPMAVAGASAGARYALGIAGAEEVDNVQRIGLIDPVGQADFGRLKLAFRMGKELIKHAPAYSKASEDPYLHPHDNFDTPEDWEKMVGPKELNSQVKQNEARMQKFWQLPKVLTHPNGLSADFIRAMENNPDAELTYVAPQKSELTRGSHRYDAGQFLAFAAMNSSDKHLIERVRVLSIPEATHYFTSAYPRKVGSLIADIIE